MDLESPATGYHRLKRIVLSVLTGGAGTALVTGGGVGNWD